MDLSADPADEGSCVRVDLARMIDAVYLAPRTPPWIHKLVVRPIKRLGQNLEVRQSDLSTDPVY